MIVAWHPNAIKGISALVASQPLDAWKGYLTFTVIDHWSGRLDDVDPLHAARSRRAKLVLHFHGLDHDESVTGFHLLLF